jgi:hypothetical protein
MIFAKIENGEVVQYPIFDGYLTQIFPDLQLPITESTPLPEGYVIVYEDQEPIFDWQYQWHEVTPTLGADGRWMKTYQSIPLTEEEKQGHIIFLSRQIREKRNTLLLLSDWTQLSDSPLTAEKKAEFVTYRQALRDISSQEGFPINVTWPQLP